MTNRRVNNLIFYILYKVTQRKPRETFLGSTHLVHVCRVEHRFIFTQFQNLHFYPYFSWKMDLWENFNFLTF
jgi:hypothetical protein